MRHLPVSLVCMDKTDQKFFRNYIPDFHLAAPLQKITVTLLAALHGLIRLLVCLCIIVPVSVDSLAIRQIILLAAVNQ